MSLGRIGQNSAEEFFETIIYMTAYNEAKDRIKEYTEGIENPILKEATESAMNVAVFGGIYMLIRYEEMILDKAFAVASAIIGSLMLLPKKAFEKLKGGLRGRKLGILSKVLGNVGNDGVGKANVIAKQLGNFMFARNNQYQAGQLINSAQQNRRNVYERDRSSLMLGSSMADNYVNSLMFKMMTSSFTSSDEIMIKKILGRETSSTLNIEDINKIGSFIFTKDSTGKVTGLTEQFFTLVNGLGYIHKQSGATAI